MKFPGFYLFTNLVSKSFTFFLEIIYNRDIAIDDHKYFIFKKLKKFTLIK